MKIFLAWKMPNEEEQYLRTGLADHNIWITSSTDISAIQPGDLSDTDVLIAGNATRDIINRGNNIKLIQSMIAGVSHIDLETARQKGIITASVKGANADEVAEHTLMLMLSLAKNSKKYFQDVLDGSWDKEYSTNLRGKTLGVIGYGNIGSRVAILAKAFGMQVAAIRNRPNLQRDMSCLDYLGGVEDMAQVFKSSDIVVLSVPKTKYTAHLINKHNLAHFKDGAYLVNVSRGSVVDESSVLEALASGRLGGFGTDVFEQEPNSFRNKLYRIPQVVCTPHVAAYSADAKRKCLDAVIENINAFSRGLPVKNCVDYEIGY